MRRILEDLEDTREEEMRTSEDMVMEMSSEEDTNIAMSMSMDNIMEEMTREMVEMSAREEDTMSVLATSIMDTMDTMDTMDMSTIMDIIMDTTMETREEMMNTMDAIMEAKEEMMRETEGMTKGLGGEKDARREEVIRIRSNMIRDNTEEIMEVTNMSPDSLRCQITLLRPLLL